MGAKSDKIQKKIETMNLNGDDRVDGCFPSKQAPEGRVVECLMSQEAASSQPATQPLDSSIDMDASQGLGEEAWGQLYPHCGTFPRTQLSQRYYPLFQQPHTDRHRNGPQDHHHDNLRRCTTTQWPKTKTKIKTSQLHPDAAPPRTAKPPPR